MKAPQVTKVAIVATMMIALPSIPMLAQAESDVIKLECSQHSNKVVGFGNQTAVCSDCTDSAPATHAFMKDDKSRITHQEGHHNEVRCNMSFDEPFKFPAKVNIPGVGEQTIEVDAFKKVCVHGRAKATHMGETARIDCNADAHRIRIN